MHFGRRSPPADWALLTTTSALKAYQPIGEKLRILIYDLYMSEADPASRDRLKKTTDIQYIGRPYFSQDEASAVRKCLVDVMLLPEQEAALGNMGVGAAPIMGKTVGEALTLRQDRLHMIRRAAGNPIPCTYREEAVVYSAVFAWTREEVTGEQLDTELRDRLGLGWRKRVCQLLGKCIVILGLGGVQGGGRGGH